MTFGLFCRFGGTIYSPRTGIILNNELADFCGRADTVRAGKVTDTNIAFQPQAIELKTLLNVVSCQSDIECNCLHRWTASFLNDSSNSGVKVWRAPCDWWIGREHDYHSSGHGNSIELRLHPFSSASLFICLHDSLLFLQSIMNRLWLGMNLTDAIAAPIAFVDSNNNLKLESNFDKVRYTCSLKFTRLSI